MAPLGRLKLWIAAVGCAGLGLGLVGGLMIAEVQAHEGQHQADPWLARFCDKYRLTPVQERRVRLVRRARDREQRAVYAKNFDHLSDRMRGLIEEVNRRADDRIYTILDPGQRRLYRQDRQTGPDPAGGSPKGARNR